MRLNLFATVLMRDEEQRRRRSLIKSYRPLILYPALHTSKQVFKERAASVNQATSPSATTPSAATAQDMPPRHYAFTEV